MERIESQVDQKGRVLIPAKVRERMKIEPFSKVQIRIEKVRPRRPFSELSGSFKGLGGGKGAVELLHEESPFR